MTASSIEPQTRRWRSRDFVQPLFVTILGVWAIPILVFLVWRASASIGDFSDCTGECGTARLASGLVTGSIFLLAWLAETVIVGFVVGRTSRDPGLALRAVLVGVVVPPLAVALVLVPGAIENADDIAFATLSTLAGAALVGLVLMIPFVIGFGIGRALRPPAARSA